MATQIIMHRVGDSLKPVDEAGFAALESVPFGKEVKATVVVPRNVKYHRMFFAALHFAFKHQDTWPTFEAFRARVTVGVGHGDIVSRDGVMVLCPRSIGFAKMDDISFKQFAERVVNEVCNTIIPNMPRAEVEGFFEILEGNAPAYGDDHRKPRNATRPTHGQNEAA